VATFAADLKIATAFVAACERSCKRPSPAMFMFSPTAMA
jgi:hypothetical protein